MIRVTLPRLLGDVIGGVRQVSVMADDVGGALRAACDRHPELTVHLFDETGAVRPHVTCLLNGVVVRDALDRPVGPDDDVVVLQAVSGG